MVFWRMRWDWGELVAFVIVSLLLLLLLHLLFIYREM